MVDIILQFHLGNKLNNDDVYNENNISTCE